MIPIVLGLVLVWGICLVVIQERGIRRDKRLRQAREFETLIRKVITVHHAFDDGELPDDRIKAWTPAEREALGVNETDRLINRIDRELRRIEPAPPDAPDLSSMRVPGLPPAEPDGVALYSWGSVDPIRIVS